MPDTIKEHEGKNAGGVKKVYIILLKDVTYIPYATGLEISANITSSAFTEITPVNNGCSMQENNLTDAHGPIYSYEIPVTLNKDQKDTTAAVNKFVGRKCLVIEQDHNDIHRIIGSKDQPTRIFYETVKSKNLSGTNTYTIYIRCEQRHPAYYYTGTITT